jgi:hypothetical protein
MPDGRVAIEMHDKVSVLRVLAKAAGWLDAPDRESDKPSIVGINMKGPSIEDAEVIDGQDSKA